jgi:hypothetical protein
MGKWFKKEVSNGGIIYLILCRYKFTAEGWDMLIDFLSIQDKYLVFCVRLKRKKLTAWKRPLK